MLNEYKARTDELHRRHIGLGYCAGTCGELIQGFNSDGSPFHVSFPIELGTTCFVRYKSTLCPLTLSGDFGPKAERAAYAAARLVGLKAGVIHLSYKSDLLVGKGMASSTADIAATVRAICDLEGYAVSNQKIVEIATSIESTDAAPFPGMAAMNQKTGELHHVTKHLPDIHVLLVIPDNVVITSDVHLSKENNAKQDRLLKTFCSLEFPTAEQLGELATESALINQQDNPNRFFDALHVRYRELGAVGIAVGHTGCLLALMFETFSKAEKAIDLLAPQLSIIGPVGLQLTRLAYRRSDEAIFNTAA